MFFCTLVATIKSPTPPPACICAPLIVQWRLQAVLSRMLFSADVACCNTEQLIFQTATFSRAAISLSQSIVGTVMKYLSLDGAEKEFCTGPLLL